MNVYDFDGTIFASDCSIGFCFWCMNRHPKLWFTFFPKALRNLILKKKGKMTEYLMQRKFFGYLTLINDFDEQIERYWDKNEKKIAPWYLAQKRPDDLECVSKVEDVQFRGYQAAFQGAFPKAYWLQVEEKQHRNAA